MDPNLRAFFQGFGIAGLLIASVLLVAFLPILGGIGFVVCAGVIGVNRLFNSFPEEIKIENVQR